MAYNNVQLLLGFEDEVITDKYKGQVNFTTNKFGGKPDWPSGVKIDPPACPLCKLPRLLILQIYAPLDATTYHRTLYVFTCLNPNCWNNNECWTCIRVQSAEQLSQPKDIVSSSQTTCSATDWCADADDWGDDNNANVCEENGNLINENVERVSDEDDESISIEECIRAGLGNLYVDERNANNAEAQGAVGSLHSPTATAEIEGDEGEVISIDTPTMPQKDLGTVLQEVAPLPQELYRKDKQNVLEFIPHFVSVSEETLENPNVVDRHVRELLQEYQKNNDDFMDATAGVDGGGGGGGEMTLEKYEKSAPAHGDKMFHYFLSKIQENPGQILRYGRESSTPLLLHLIQQIPKKCPDCQSEMVFEFQILPTLIPKLHLNTDVAHVTRVEFGNVLIFTCRSSCWSSDVLFKQEEIVFQAEM